MASVEITYLLSDAGKRASLKAGGDGADNQEMVVQHDNFEFSRAVDLAYIDAKGHASICMHFSSNKKWDHVPSVVELLNYKEELIAAEKAKEEADKKEKEDFVQTLLKAGPTETPWVKKGYYNYYGTIIDCADGYAAHIAKKNLGRFPELQAKIDAAIAHQKYWEEQVKDHLKAEKAKAEEEKKRKEEEEKARDAKMAEWVDANGSDHVKLLKDKGFQWMQIARGEFEAKLIERMESEFGLVLADDLSDWDCEWETHKCPCLNDLLFLDSIKAKLEQEDISVDIISCTYTEEGLLDEDESQAVNRSEFRVKFKYPDGVQTMTDYIPKDRKEGAK